MKDITTIGEILIDLTQNGVNENKIPEFTANPGGAPANLAVAAAKLGVQTAFIGKVGKDAFGAQLSACLKDNHVDISGLSVDPKEHTTLAVVSVDETGERDFSFYRDPSADVNLKKEDIPTELLTDSRIFHFGSVSLTASPAYDATLWAVSQAKAHGSYISYDPNYRANLWSDQTSAISRIKEPLPMVDILKVSDEELPLITGTNSLEDGTKCLQEMGIRLILVTLGAKGAFYRFGDCTGLVPGIPCKVGDTNGAGDTFFGAFLSRLCKVDDLESLSLPELEAMILFANKAASITTSRRGAIPAMPNLQEVEAMNL